ncbi:hypothetical protein MRX96_004466 [Rhipicephalus microplus]
MSARFRSLGIGATSVEAYTSRERFNLPCKSCEGPLHAADMRDTSSRAFLLPLAHCPVEGESAFTARRAFLAHLALYRLVPCLSRVRTLSEKMRRLNGVPFNGLCPIYRDSQSGCVHRGEGACGPQRTERRGLAASNTSISSESTEGAFFPFFIVTRDMPRVKACRDLKWREGSMVFLRASCFLPSSSRAQKREMTRDRGIVPESAELRAAAGVDAKAVEDTAQRLPQVQRAKGRELIAFELTSSLA